MSKLIEWICSFNRASGETKLFVVSVAFMMISVIAMIAYTIIRLDGDRSYDKAARQEAQKSMQKP